MSHERSLIGSVFERTTPRTPSAPSSRFTKTPTTGFPTAKHRSKSAFARAQDEAHPKGSNANDDVPSVASTRWKPRTQQPVTHAGPIIDTKPIPTDTDALLRQIHQENARAIARMSHDEIELEKRAIVEQLGEGTGELLGRVQAARRRKEVKEKEARAELEGVQDKIKDMASGRDHEHVAHIASPIPRRVSDGLATKPGVLRVKSLENLGRTVPSPLPATSSTRPSSRTGRKLRFAEVTPNDVHVYESAPRSPKRTIFALPPPPDMKDDSIVSLGTFHKHTGPPPQIRSNDSATCHQHTGAPKYDEPEEGTPEYIRRRYFPNLPANDPSLSWIEPSSLGTTDPSVPRFDFQGVPIPASLSASLPSHLGLHHHADGSHAGYTIDDIFLLARSTVPAQRASMLGILAKIAHRLGRQVRHVNSPDETVMFVGQEGELRKRILAAGLAAIDQIGSLGVRAVEVVWESLVEWDGATSDMDCVELCCALDVLASLQLDYLLPQVTDILSHAALPSESLAQLLAVLHWLAQQSNQVSDTITTTPRLVRTLLDTFLLTPMSHTEGSVLPNPLALQVLTTLASASRSNASALVDPADALLRFVTPTPPSSPYPPALATTLLTYTLQFYTTLASYGLYSHIATTASPIFTDVGAYILSYRNSTTERGDSMFTELCTAWTSLIHAWTVCATDPHATTPPHEILWSQLCGLGWARDVRELSRGLEGSDSLYVAIWDAEAAWLEGARINGIKGGEVEREEALQVLRNTFSTHNGTDFSVVQRALEAVQRGLGEGDPTTVSDGERVLKLLGACSVLASALRLWLACLPPLNDGVPLSAPPFSLPLSDLSALSAMLVKYSVWTLPSTLGAGYLQVYLRPLTRFIINFHRVSWHIPGTTPQLWFAQALVFLSRLLPGDESCALGMLDAFLLVTPQFVGVDPAQLPRGIHMDVLRPFFEYTVRPSGEVSVAPLRPSTESISRSSTLRLPPCSSTSPLTFGNEADATSTRTFTAGLPPTRDFLFAPLTHLLRSGTSPVFRALAHSHWTGNEVDVVCATLLLACAARRVLVAHGLDAFVQGATEVVFACMRVCMLEHDVGTVDDGEDVFRDAGVERLMTWLLEPFTVRSLRRSPGSRSTATTVHTTTACTLEEASAPYLGATTPFYQFYTDLVALYDAVSFGHPTFAALVVTPLAMGYAVDYRRALWCGGDVGAGSGGGDAEQPIGSGGASTGTGVGGGGGGGLGEVVRSVRIPIEDVVCTSERGDPREYLYPIERDAGVLGAYVAALVGRGVLHGFLRLVAVHHVACTVWDNQDEDEGERNNNNNNELEPEGRRLERQDEIRARLLRAVLVHGGADVVRDVVLYRQRARSEGEMVWPPGCFLGGDAEDRGWRVRRRLGFVRRTMGEEGAARVDGVLAGI